MLLTLRKCKLTDGKLVPKGNPIQLDILDACKLLAPSKDQRARLNILSARAGQYLGLLARRNDCPTNFLLINPNPNGDIRWLLKKRADIESRILDVYYVEEVVIPRHVEDLPPMYGPGGPSSDGDR